MSMQTLTWDVDAAAVAGNSDAYSLALATQARQTRPTPSGVSPAVREIHIRSLLEMDLSSLTSKKNKKIGGKK